MPALKITRATGEVSTHEITPVAEVAFESYHGGSLQKLYREEEKRTHIYWMAHDLLKRAKVSVPPFGDEFLLMLKKVEIIGDEENPKDAD